MTVTSGAVASGNTVTSENWKRWYKQDPITPNPLPYELVKNRRYNVVFTPKPGWAHVVDSYGLNACQIPAQLSNFIRNGIVYPTLPMDRLYNATYEKFTGTMKGEVAELAVNLAERKEAFSMMLNRFIRLGNAARAFRQFHFGAAARLLGTPVPSLAQRKRWETSRQWGSSWLEWHFGWSPLMGDIYSAIQILDATFPWADVIETSGWNLDYDISRTNGPIVGSGFERDTFRGMAYCRMSSSVEISDLTLVRANQLGLINPTSLGWELIPFSFLADWFGTIGLWLGQFTDFCGLNLRRPQHVYFIRGTGHKLLDSALFGVLRFDYSVVGVVRRTGSFPGPTIALRRLKGLSVTRGLTAISLLLGIFSPR